MSYVENRRKKERKKEEMTIEWNNEKGERHEKFFLEKAKRQKEREKGKENEEGAKESLTRIASSYDLRFEKKSLKVPWMEMINLFFFAGNLLSVWKITYHKS